MLATQSGMAVNEFRADVRHWPTTAWHPRWNHPYTDLVYQPMIEVLALLRANGFTNFIVTGGSASFVREYSGKRTGPAARDADKNETEELNIDGSGVLSSGTAAN